MEKPRRINADTDIVATFFPAGPLGFLPVNWYLIRAQEPVLVDTAFPIQREQFLTTLGSMIDPARSNGSSSRTTTPTTPATWARC